MWMMAAAIISMGGALTGGAGVGASLIPAGTRGAVVQECELTKAFERFDVGEPYHIPCTNLTLQLSIFRGNNKAGVTTLVQLFGPDAKLLFTCELRTAGSGHSIATYAIPGSNGREVEVFLMGTVTPNARQESRVGRVRVRVQAGSGAPCSVS